MIAKSKPTRVTIYLKIRLFLNYKTTLKWHKVNSGNLHCACAALNWGPYEVATSVHNPTATCATHAIDSHAASTVAFDYRYLIPDGDLINTDGIRRGNTTLGKPRLVANAK